MGIFDPSKTYHSEVRRILREEAQTNIRPVILKECAKCHDLVDRETLFAGVCRKCPPPKVVRQLDGPVKF